jgi:hypothetical protein
MRNNSALAQKVISDTPRAVGRPPLWSENMQARFKAGTFARIAKALKAGEDRTAFIREAVERELERRTNTLPLIE